MKSRAKQGDQYTAHRARVPRQSGSLEMSSPEADLQLPEEDLLRPLGIMIDRLSRSSGQNRQP
jgi:hypothetical protein